MRFALQVMVGLVYVSVASAGQAMAQVPSPMAPPDPGANAPAQVRKVRTPRPSEYGLQHPFRFSIGSYRIDSSDGELSDRLDNVDDAALQGTVFKLDYSFFRPTRHEAMVSLSVFDKTGFSGNSVYATAMAEYRLRFGGFGKGYYGWQIGTGINDWGQGNLLLGSALGVDISHSFFLDFRTVSNTHTRYYRSMFMVGTRF